MSNSRRRHVCGKEVLRSGEYNIVVAGGQTAGGGVTSIEIYNTDTYTWSSGSSFDLVHATLILRKSAGHTMSVFSDGL